MNLTAIFCQSNLNSQNLTNVWRLRIHFNEKEQKAEDLIVRKSINIQRAIDVARKFKVSIGAVYNIIINLAVCRPNLFSETGRISRKILNSQRIISLIQNYLDRTSHSFAWDDICRHLFKTFGIKLRRKDFVKF